ncbi:helix-turn-helix domain-containing protein [Catellatospora paridis]|uniref:helix-turn-helix domain-containing protein n=1 Tax=Catellatospora paridis TaxID=1617086 RepID=UPI0012D41D1B|nr:MerR family transcriptional regulator [Catellatospora paridis]
MGQPDDMFGDENYPAYTMGRAAEIIGATPDFLRKLDELKLINPLRSSGGHRRYSRYQLRLAARAREMVDQGTAVEAACRIIILEDRWSIRAPLWKPRAGSSSSRTNSKKPSARTSSAQPTDLPGR